MIFKRDRFSDADIEKIFEHEDIKDAESAVFDIAHYNSSPNDIDNLIKIMQNDKRLVIPPNLSFEYAAKSFLILACRNCRYSTVERLIKTLEPDADKLGDIYKNYVKKLSDIIKEES